MHVDRKVVRQLRLVDLPDHPPGDPREPLAQFEQDSLLRDVLLPGQCVSALVAEDPLQSVGEGVLPRQRDDIGGRALQHRHMRGLVGHRREKRHGGRAASDHHDSLACVVEILRPVLRMHDLTAEPILSGEVGTEPFVVVVVAGTAEDPTRADLRPFTGIGPFDVDQPACVVRGPGGGHDLVVVPDVAGEAVVLDRLVQVVENPRGVGDRLLVRPRFELVAEGVQVRVRANARITEEVPGASGGPRGPRRW